MSLIINKKDNATTDDSLIPLINIVFLLLIFFMVAGKIELMTNGLELPQSNKLSSVNNSHRRLEMSRQGQLLLDGESIEVSALAQLLDIHQPLDILFDKNLTAIDIHPVLQQLTSIGVERVRLLTQRSER